MENKLVHLEGNRVFCDSRKVAEKFGKQHLHVLEKIDKTIARIKALGIEKPTPKNEGLLENFNQKARFYRGQNFRYFEMNRPAYSLLVMSFTGKKAFEIKRTFNLAFYLMEQALLRQDNLEWKGTREQGKQIRLDLTDEIKAFVDYAIVQGSENASKYYITITKMQYKALGLIEKNEKIDKQFRNTLDMMDLHNLLSAEQVARKALMDGIDQELHYKDIFQLAKKRVFQLADIILISPKQIIRDNNENT